MPPKFEFEIRDKDIAGRIGKLRIGKKEIETPAIMPVVNPNKLFIPLKELEKDFRAKVVMTNAYIILRDDHLREEVLSKGIHRFLDFDGVIATDSGSYQLMEYGNVITSNKEILGFQKEIGSDIGSFLDIPTSPDTYKPRAEKQLEITLGRAKEAKRTGFIVNAGIQGSIFPDLREKAAKEIGRDFRLCAVGGIVPLMEEYRFSELVDVISIVKRNIPTNRVVHAFGLGHPMTLSLAVALGCDLFDSASYALYAQRLRYMTEYGTKKLEHLTYLPCECPVCSRYGMELKELDVDELIRELARHNLYTLMREINVIKQAIKEGSLWELITMRCRSHPALLSGFRSLMKYGEWLSTLDNITGKSSFYLLDHESRKRSEVINARKRMGRVSPGEKVRIPPFGEVPAQIINIYPFGNVVAPEDEKADTPPNTRDIDKIRGIMEYQFGSGAGDLIPEGVRIKKSRKTGRIRWIYRKKELIASVRATDHFIIPKDYLAKRLHEKFSYPNLRVAVDDEAKPFILEGKSVFCKFVQDIDPDLRAGDEVLVVDKEDDLLGVGTLFLSPTEVRDFNRGMAARMR